MIREYKTPLNRRLAMAKYRVTAKGRASQQRGYFKYMYGLSEEARLWMLNQQGGACALCEKDATCVDHDHETGHVRALLCKGCNRILGSIESDRDRFQRAMNYARTA